MTCGKTQGFLAKHGITAAVQVDAKKGTLDARAALALLKDIDLLVATKGKRVVQVDLRKERPTEADLRALVVGPSGNLRAPTLRQGRTLLVGFDEAAYRNLLLDRKKP